MDVMAQQKQAIQILGFSSTHDPYMIYYSIPINNTSKKEKHRGGMVDRMKLGIIIEITTDIIILLLPETKSSILK